MLFLLLYQLLLLLDGSAVLRSYVLKWFCFSSLLCSAAYETCFCRLFLCAVFNVGTKLKWNAALAVMHYLYKKMCLKQPPVFTIDGSGSTVTSHAVHVVGNHLLESRFKGQEMGSQGIVVVSFPVRDRSLGTRPGAAWCSGGSTIVQAWTTKGWKLLREGRGTSAQGCATVC